MSFSSLSSLFFTSSTMFTKCFRFIEFIFGIFNVKFSVFPLKYNNKLNWTSCILEIPFLSSTFLSFEQTFYSIPCEEGSFSFIGMLSHIGSRKGWFWKGWWNLAVMSTDFLFACRKLPAGFKFLSSCLYISTISW